MIRISCSRDEPVILRSSIPPRHRVAMQHGYNCWPQFSFRAVQVQWARLPWIISIFVPAHRTDSSDGWVFEHLATAERAPGLCLYCFLHGCPWHYSPRYET